MKRPKAEKRRLFLEAVSRGASAIEAAAYAGVARATVYGWADKEEKFEEEWQQAEAYASGRLRMKAYELAWGGRERLLVWLLTAADQKQRDQEAALNVDAVGEIQIIGLEEGEVHDGEFIEFLSS